MPSDQNLDLPTKPRGYYTQTRPEMLDFIFESANTPTLRRRGMTCLPAGRSGGEKTTGPEHRKPRASALGEDVIPKSARRVLDVGCGEGLFGWQLKQKLDAEVWGVEIDTNAASLAQKKLNKVLVGDISQLINNLPNEYFDCIVFNDVLEHLVDPFSILSETKKKLNTEGVVVCSIPNVRYFRTLKNLLVEKQWKYEDEGVLDKTHLRFFTQKSVVDMFNSLGYKVLKIEGINATESWKFKLVNAFSLGFLSDTKYLQFACVAKPR